MFDHFEADRALHLSRLIPQTLLLDFFKPEVVI